MEGASKSLGALAGLAGQPPGPSQTAPGPDAWEATNAHLVSSALVAAATLRRETRGSHWREDFPAADDAFRGHLITHLAAEDGLVTTYEPVTT